MTIIPSALQDPGQPFIGTLVDASERVSLDAPQVKSDGSAIGYFEANSYLYRREGSPHGYCQPGNYTQ